MKDEALKLALEVMHNQGDVGVDEWIAAEAAIKQALALDKMAENARELGLDYEPVLKDNSNYRLDPPFAEPVGCEGAIVNGRVYADRLEHDYKFECEAGPLHLCNDWVEFRRCFEWLAEHATPPAAQRQWVGLIPEEVEDIVEHCDGVGWDVAKHIEDKLRSKNNA